MDNLTAEEIAELRRLVPPVARGNFVSLHRVDYERARELLPRLLDEVEHSRDLRRIVGGCPPEHGVEHALYCISCCAQLDPKRMALIHEQRCYFLIHERESSPARSG